MAASCQANESCGVGQDCSICAEADDCRQCANFTTNLECVSRDSCIWDQGTLPAYPITAADIVFVVAPIVCGLYTLDGFLRHDDDDANWTRSGAHIFLIICFLADVGFTVGKLFPTSYLCLSLDCAKITHNSVMTLAGFLFSAFECIMLDVMEDESYEDSEVRNARRAQMVKLLQRVLRLAYIIYDVATSPGVGTPVLVVFACLAEVLLLCFEGYTIFRWVMPCLREMPCLSRMSELWIRRDRTRDRREETAPATAAVEQEAVVEEAKPVEEPAGEEVEVAVEAAAEEVEVAAGQEAEGEEAKPVEKPADEDAEAPVEAAAEGVEAAVEAEEEAKPVEETAGEDSEAAVESAAEEVETAVGKEAVGEEEELRREQEQIMAMRKLGRWVGVPV